MGEKRKLKRTRSLDSPADLISDLPRDVIDAIMERLPLCDAARLSSMSRKWRDIWTSTPYLNFDANFFNNVHRKGLVMVFGFSGIVSNILFQHKGPILKFSLYVPLLELQPNVVNQWISFLSTSGIREFSLENKHLIPLKLSSHLFSFAGLEKLKLCCCVLNPPPDFMVFRRLVDLELYYVTFREGTFEDLITRCPQLEKLNVIKCEGTEHVNVNAPVLKYLVVDGTFRSLCVKIAKNLVSVSIIFDKLTTTCHKTSLCDLVEFLANSSKLEKLCLGGHFCKVLFIEGLIPATFKKLRYLVLQSICLDDPNFLSFVVRTIQRCPNIQNLKISVEPSCNFDIQTFVYNPDMTLDHLRHAKVDISRASDVELKLIEFLLACSPVLEMLSITFLRIIKSSCYQSRMLNFLNQFRRASPKVQVIFSVPLIFIESQDTRGDSEFSGGSSGNSYTSSSNASRSDLDSDSDSFASSDSDSSIKLSTDQSDE